MLELAREYGTPAYVVAEDDLRARAREFVPRDGRPPRRTARVLFAAKAFPCTAVLRIFAEEGLGVDVASAGELYMALRAGFDPGRIVVHGNAKSLGELRTAVEHGLVVAIDNLDEIDRLERFAGAGPQPVLLRVVPEVQTDTHHAVATGHADQKFGLTLEEAAAPSTASAPPAGPTCAASTRTSARSSSTSRPTARRWRRSPSSARFPVYDLGGGLAAAYTPEHRPPSVDEWVAGVVGAAHDLLGAQRGRAVGRAGPLAGRQRGRHALHRRVGQAPRVDVGRGRWRV